MSDKPKPDDDNEHWFWKFLMLPGPPWEAQRHPLFLRGMTVLFAVGIPLWLLLMLLKWLLSK
jgi:hypothetical protein